VHAVKVMRGRLDVSRDSLAHTATEPPPASGGGSLHLRLPGERALHHAPPAGQSDSNLSLDLAASSALAAHVDHGNAPIVAAAGKRITRLNRAASKSSRRFAKKLLCESGSSAAEISGESG
jgi:hypothetical protein